MNLTRQVGQSATIEHKGVSFGVKVVGRPGGGAHLMFTLPRGAVLLRDELTEAQKAELRLREAGRVLADAASVEEGES